MTREDVLKKLYDKYITPTKSKRDTYIGVEIEMPIVNLEGKAVDFDVVHLLTSEFLHGFGFQAVGFDEQGKIYNAVNKENGDVFSYDCSYNNLELSFGKEKNIDNIHARFEKYYNFIQHYFKKYNYTLTGMGINPNRKVNKNVPIENGRYKMLFNHLSSFTQYPKLPMYFHEYPNFGMFSSASQVQLDVKYEQLADVINTFNKLEPIKALLFNNSVLLGENEELHCCRDMLWENSTHGINPHNIGMHECTIKDPDDLLNYLATESIYCVERDGKYINFSPVNIVEYFSKDKLTGEYVENDQIHRMEFSPRPEDIDYLRTFKFEDLTFRGTIEFRSCCNQPISACMTIAAFHLGLLENVEKLKETLDNDTVLYGCGYTAGELRKIFTKAKLPEFIDTDKLYSLVKEILDLCADGLKKRGCGEEKYLLPLYERTEKRTNPAKMMMTKLENGTDIYDIVRDYARL